MSVNAASEKTRADPGYRERHPISLVFKDNRRVLNPMFVQDLRIFMLRHAIHTAVGAASDAVGGCCRILSSAGTGKRLLFRMQITKLVGRLQPWLCQ